MYGYDDIASLTKTYLKRSAQDKGNRLKENFGRCQINFL